MYTRKKVNKNSIRWECVKRTSHSCKGIATTDIEMTTFDLGVSHCHGGNVAEGKATKARWTMKEKAMPTMDKLCQIFAAAVLELDAITKGTIATEGTVKHALRHARQKAVPKQPDSLKDLVIEGEWATTAGPEPENFLLHENGKDSCQRTLNTL